ncbi:bifunctional 3-(3-hydroxy-phenyl)propionate/3-hydroxycinnamic acid hydroxylase MhpA [Variovorax saccharolyticus]|uniref:bifunctional 3-(3-hydroxy-phenyl)propionate/3-hydroxycinnamic acid hydroxylase MhpA n=1 Tax=Variovorax saccharolyticus TaxID=3053516 RepID=UPI00257501F0|nr:bifunctional 3-(3-hydroxy-phenyl)propionate/3-hydroxycinnamic acid hydroxylase [Variovorax sp. J31P216]MDM0025274.1 bifunctional 3-(3-hydroxy-phenyl)propionate/3-hydroxycinnamic acid hydroxylase [Variovorax sp. J31P216]
MPERDDIADVAIVGLGPTGAVLANLLGAAGRSVRVIEKEAGIFPLPRAIHFDGEVLRILQAAGLREQALAISRPGTQGMHFVNGAGETMLIRGGTAAVGPHGCANNYYFHQPQLEAVLREGLARFPRVQVELRHELVGVEQDGEAVSLSHRSAETGQVHTTRARYVVGCDGARSGVRESIGSPMVDLGLRQPWLVFDVVLEQPVDLPAHTVQHCDPRRPMTYCNVVGERRRWEIMVLPDDDREALVQPQNLWKMVAPWVRPDQARLERAAIYTFQSVIADGWRDRRLFLAGDACHQTPPFLGQGMCAGIRDASNLAWKLDAVLAGRAPDALLDTYESERKPHVRALIELAVRLGDIIQTTDPVLASERDARFQAGRPEIFELPPQLLGAGAFDPTTPELAGRPFPQPQLEDGRLLDDLLERRSAVIGSRQALSAASPETALRWQRSGAVVIDRPDPRLQDWLRAHDANAVILRPDRYIVGVARSGADLDRISQYLPVVP